MAKQVRLDDDVAATLAALAEQAGHSITNEANRVLRFALARMDPRPVAPNSRGRATANAAPGPCAHPPSRRVGAMCGACGRRLTNRWAKPAR